MTEGPPPSAAGPSQAASSSSSPQGQAVTAPLPNYFPPGQSPYYSYPPNWQSNQQQTWPVNAFSYNSPYHQPYAPNITYQTPQFRHYMPSVQPPIPPSPNPQHPLQVQPKVRPPSPSPSPPPKQLPRYWDAALKAFFVSVGLTQSLRGFEADMVVMNPAWEKKEVPEALEELRSSLTRLLDTNAIPDESAASERPLEERKLDYVHVEKGAEPLTPGTINKSISLLLARNRARNNASNRAEFLHARKRRRVSPSQGDESTVEDASCARTDAKTVDRDVMMKFDVARNEEGPLRRTMKVEGKEATLRDGTMRGLDDEMTARKYPGLDERLRNIESHLAVRYVPSPPVSLLRRLQFLEDHIIDLEREYPPWAALHFNQPRRGWPAPPRPTPLIVPSHLTSTAPAAPVSGGEGSSTSGTLEIAGRGIGEVKGKARATKSSLHRAVLERLEVQKAMSDLRGDGEPSP